MCIWGKKIFFKQENDKHNSNLEVGERGRGLACGKSTEGLCD